jgi:hypothetical protein
VAEDSIRCHWFDGATAKTEIFPAATIRLYEGPKPAAGLRRSYRSRTVVAPTRTCRLCA